MKTLSEIIDNSIKKNNIIDVWEIYTDPIVMKEVIDDMSDYVSSKIMKNRNKKAIIGAVGESGCILAYNVGQRLNLSVIIINERDFSKLNARKFLPNVRDTDNCQIILIDGIVESTMTCLNAYKMCKERGFTDISIFSILFNFEMFNEKLAEKMIDVYYEPLFMWNLTTHNAVLSGKQALKIKLISKKETTKPNEKMDDLIVKKCDEAIKIIKSNKNREDFLEFVLDIKNNPLNKEVNIYAQLQISSLMSNIRNSPVFSIIESILNSISQIHRKWTPQNTFFFLKQMISFLKIEY
jgi:hypothetical protein